MGAYGGAGNCGWPEKPYELTIDPTGPVAVPKGDTLYFHTLIRNNTGNTASGDYWLSVFLPDSNEIVIPAGILNFPNPVSGQIASNDSVSRSYELYVPTAVDSGSYRLIGRIGLFPSASVDEKWLDFQVTE